MSTRSSFELSLCDLLRFLDGQAVMLDREQFPRRCCMPAKVQFGLMPHPTSKSAVFLRDWHLAMS